MAAHGIRRHLRSCINAPSMIRQWFWDAVLADLGIEFYTPYSQVIDTSPGLPWTRWCVGGEMNIVHNCLDKRIGTPAEQAPAIRWTTEEGQSGVLTYGDLYRQVNRAANALAAPRLVPRRRRRPLHADDARDCRGVFRDHQDWRDRAAAVFRLRRRRHRHAPLGRRRGRAHHRGRRAAAEAARSSSSRSPTTPCDMCRL